MPKKFKFHGAFKSKEKAKAKEKQVGGFIREYILHGQKRYSVITER